ncbi:MAG: hypothetical protein JJU40_12975 [Rhodobacteraceae bacterium]|nr:hypothetical protein [Paracoccaceae bacterium]
MTETAAFSGPILCMTLGAPDLGAALSAYESGLGYLPVAEGEVDGALAALWGAPALAGRPWALIAPRGQGPDAPGALRVIGDIPHAGEGAALASLGWAAAELSVADADAHVASALAAGFAALGAVRPLGSNPAIRAGQVAGPGGEALYLTDVRAYDGPLDLHRAGHGVDRCFIAVLASDDLEADRAWLEERGIGRRISDREVVVPVLQARMGLKEGEALRISSLQLAGGCLIEIDAYPRGASGRNIADGWPCGVAMLSILDPRASGPTRPEAPYMGGQVEVSRLPGGALLERIALP